MKSQLCFHYPLRETEPLDSPNLETVQRDEIIHLQEQLADLKKVNRKIFAIAEEHKDKTIEKVLGKSDEELGVDFLKGKLKL